MLKAITLYEPWASLMAIGAKRNETRPCRINHRGDIAKDGLGSATQCCGHPGIHHSI